MRIRALVLLAALSLPGFAQAWGPDGHRITGLVAQELLTPKARLRLNQLMRTMPAGPVENLADFANQMDVFRMALSLEVPNSEKWHYDNQPLCAKKTYEQYCADGHCASAKIPHFFKRLSDAALPEPERARAALFLVHMVGDIHQPLHAADDEDLGGNRKNTLPPGADMPRNLHRVWDSDTVRAALRGIRDGDYAALLLSRYREREIPAWQSGEAADWMKESFVNARDLVYGPLPEFTCGTPWPMEKVVALSPAYIATAAAEVPVMLTKAGARIAWLLNRALDPVEADRK
ncbi:MAG: S1/P1 nuclease [Betaproteobacteria bacterium]|nr:S1/P1 nuclease [Betaproteobacteria bacterium]